MDITTKSIMAQMGKLLEIHQVEKLPQTIGKKYTTKEKNLFSLLNELNEDELYEKLRLINWAISGAQIEIGYLLIDFESHCHFKERNEENDRILAYLSFNHHRYQAMECIYRVWERYTHAIYYVHHSKLKQKKDKGHFGEIVEELKKSKKYKEVIIGQFKEHQKHWDAIAQNRNNISHYSSCLIDGMETNFHVSPILDQTNKPIIIAKEKELDLEKELKNILDKYYYLKNLDENFYVYLKDNIR